MYALPSLFNILSELRKTLKMDRQSCERIVARLNKVYARLGDLLQLPFEGIDEMKVLIIIRECHRELLNVGRAIHPLTNTVDCFEDDEIDTSIEKDECIRIIPIDLDYYTETWEWLAGVQKKLAVLVVQLPISQEKEDLFGAHYIKDKMYDLSWKCEICERELLGIANE